MKGRAPLVLIGASADQRECGPQPLDCPGLCIDQFHFQVERHRARQEDNPGADDVDRYWLGDAMGLCQWRRGSARSRRDRALRLGHVPVRRRRTPPTGPPRRTCHRRRAERYQAEPRPASPILGRGHGRSRWRRHGGRRSRYRLDGRRGSGRPGHGRRRSRRRRRRGSGASRHSRRPPRMRRDVRDDYRLHQRRCCRRRRRSGTGSRRGGQTKPLREDAGNGLRRAIASGRVLGPSGRSERTDHDQPKCCALPTPAHAPALICRS